MPRGLCPSRFLQPRMRRMCPRTPLPPTHFMVKYCKLGPGIIIAALNLACLRHSNRLLAMANLSARWTRLASSERLGRSSQSLSVLGSQAWVFGGEVLPRQPVDNRLDVIELGSGQGTLLAFCLPDCWLSPVAPADNSFPRIRRRHYPLGTRRSADSPCWSSYRCSQRRTIPVFREGWLRHDADRGERRALALHTQRIPLETHRACKSLCTIPC